jgi:NADPH:quinone reductase-like Zn-dependent oxidoreductase
VLDGQLGQVGILVGGEPGHDHPRQVGRLLPALERQDLEALRALIESGQIVPAVDRTYPLSETPAAIRYVQEGRARGKVVISI